MKPIVKKITIISLTLAVCIGCLCIPASAQWIAGDRQLFSSSNQLLTPTRITAFATYISTGLEQGIVFNNSPAYALNPGANAGTTNPLVTTRIQSTKLDGINNDIYDALKQARTSIRYRYHSITHKQPFRYDWELDFPDTYKTPLSNDKWRNFSLQLDYQLGFQIPANRPQGDYGKVNYILGGISGTPIVASSIQFFTPVYNTSTSKLEMKKFTFSLPHEGELLELLRDKLASVGAYVSDDGKYYIATMSIGFRVDDSQDLAFTSTQNHANSNAGAPLFSVPSGIIVNYSVDYEKFNLLTWIGDSLSAIFGAELFVLGDTTVTLGGALAVPLSLMFFIAFLRKFAGG